MFAGSHLLHHKQRKSDKAETISEILKNDATAYYPTTLRLEISKQGIHHKRKVEDTAQRENRFFQSPTSNIISCQQRTQHKSRSSVRTIIKSDFLFIESQAAHLPVCFQEQRHNLHHKSFCKTVKDDEADIISDVCLAEKVHQHLPQFLHHFLVTP